MPRIRLIVSTAHEVYEALPIWSGKYTCARCAKRGTLIEMFSSDIQHRCTPHYVTSNSGWKHDDRFDIAEIDHA